MDFGTNLIFLIIFGIFGFVISKIWDVNPYRIFSDITAGAIIILFVIAMWPAIVEPEKATESISNLVDVLANNFPGIILGDIAGTIVASITGD